MSQRKIKKRNINRSTRPFNCTCGDPNCAETKIAALCGRAGHDLRRVRLSQIPELFGIADTPESVNHFLAERCISHSPERVLAGGESLGSMPFVLEFKDEYGRWGLVVFSLSPIPCNAGHSIQ